MLTSPTCTQALRLSSHAPTRCGSFRFRALFVVLAALAILLVTTRALAARVDSRFPVVHKYFPYATRFGAIHGKPPAAAVYNGKKIIGYVFQTKMIAPVPAYSGKPVNILVGIDARGKIVGTQVLEEHEPIFLVGIPVKKLYEFVSQFIGHNVRENIVVGGDGGKGSVSIDAISSATVTSMACNETIMDAALKVAVSRNLVSRAEVAGAAPSTIRKNYYESATWKSLRSKGAIRHLPVTRKMVAKAFKGQSGEVVEDITRSAVNEGPKGDFIDLYYADITPPTVGRNLLGRQGYAAVMKKLSPGDEAIAVMANGIYSFKGIGYVRGGVFDRLHVVQGNKLILFHDNDYLPLISTRLKGMPDFGETGIFIIRKAFEFDPGRSWTLQLVVRRQIGPLQSIYHTFQGGYSIPAAYVTHPQPNPTAKAALWVKIWYRQQVDIAVLVAGLLVLTLILVFQDWFVRHPLLLGRLRTSFLVYTVVFIGWYGLAQLSVVNVFTLFHQILQGFHWGLFLIDPMIFVLWVFVAISLLLLGRGVYCGWICPFGALQELIGKVAEYFRFPQFKLPRPVHERLWALKYIIFLVLFGLSLWSVNMAERCAEVEPFKTAIDLHFMRSWPFVAYAVGLLAVSAFNNKFYCRYICPLGGGLSIAGRFHLFERLRRRPECGLRCRRCANECSVQAINDAGQINFNECHYCLDCQMTYWSDRKCPPLVKQRKLLKKLRGSAVPQARARTGARATSVEATSEAAGDASQRLRQGNQKN